MKESPLIVHIIPSLNNSGAGTMLYKICKHKSPNINYEVFSLTNKGPIAEKIEKLGIKVTAINLTKNPFSFFKLIPFIFKIKKVRPQCIQTWKYQSDLVGTFTGLLTKTSVIWSISLENISKDLNNSFTVIFSRICAKLSFLPERIISFTQSGVLEHIKIGYPNNKIVFIPNGFETSGLTLNNHVNEVKKIIHIGRFISKKNHISFMEIAREIHQNFKNCEFFLYGDEVDSSNKILTSRLGITPFQLMGAVTDLEVVYANADLLISTSVSEGFSNVIGEALSYGCPVISTDVGDSAIIVDDPTNTFHPEQKGEMARRAVEILSAPITVLKNREKITSRFKIENTVKQYELIFLS
jgi:glycosyltransferase involved in cell wall biosynthesis